MSSRNNNRINVPEARKAMANMKQEVANELGITKSTVSRHVSRSKERLKTSLKYGMYMLWNE